MDSSGAGAQQGRQGASTVKVGKREVNRNVVLAVCCLSLFLVSMDVTIVNVALPDIRQDLNTGVSGQQWVLDAYTLLLASFLVLAGSTADQVGRRRVFRIGLTVFTLGSVACSLAPSAGWLIAFRAVQGLGGAMLNPVALSIITNTFTDKQERSRAIGVWGAVVGISIALGPLLGGFLTDAVNWRAIFWINAPVGLATFILTFFFVPESRSDKKRRFDPLGQVLAVLTLASLVFALIEAPRLGWGSWPILGLFAVFVAAAVGLVLYENRREEPLIDPTFFRSIPFSAASLTAVLAFLSFGAFLFLGSIYLQSGRGLSAFRSGLLLLPTAVMMAVFSPLSGKLVATVGTRIPMLVSGAAYLVSALLLTRLSTDTPIWLLIVAFLLFGVGNGMVNAPITNTAVSGMPRTQAGSAAAIASTSRQVGASLGVAISGTVLAGVAAAAGKGSGTVPGLAASTHPMWWVIAGCGACIMLLALLANSQRAKDSAKAVAGLLDEGDGEGGEAQAA